MSLTLNASGVTRMISTVLPNPPAPPCHSMVRILRRKRTWKPNQKGPVFIARDFLTVPWSSNVSVNVPMSRLGLSGFLDTPLYREMYKLSGESMHLSRMSLTNWLEKGSTLFCILIAYLKNTYGAWSTDCSKWLSILYHHLNMQDAGCVCAWLFQEIFQRNC